MQLIKINYKKLPIEWLTWNNNSPTSNINKLKYQDKSNLPIYYAKHQKPIQFIIT